MDIPKNHLFKDNMHFTGLGLILLSTALFALPETGWLRVNSGSYFGWFFANYILAAGYFFVLLVSGFMRFKWSIAKNNVEHTVLLLILYLISAFSLNREIPVFEKSVVWICVYLVVQCMAIILLTYRSRSPFALNAIVHIVLGAGMLFYVYYAIYLLPLYAIGFVGGIFLGISLHVFVPLLFIVFTSLLVYKTCKEQKKYLIYFVIGFILPAIAAICFMVQWNNTKNKVNYLMNETMMNESQLPSWVKISQELPHDQFTEKMMKTDLVYSTPDDITNFWSWNMPGQSFDEVKKHDPLIMIAVLFLGKPDLSETEKIDILEAMYDSRHQAQERFWSGDMLETINVISNVKIFPAYRMAYTKKILSVRNNYEKNRWGGRQEAIYTFHLPEGSVVSSLSLWINGKEEKGLLTTKHKADSAYRTIVGVEQRDPSVVHWQEGNRVTVRVFPCTPDENRRFKIGISSPLRKDSGQLVYENIYFDGPSCKQATETVQLQFTDEPIGLALPFNFNKPSALLYKSEKQYDPYWEITFDAPALSAASFSFDGDTYAVSDYKAENEKFKAEKIYLDLNSAWSKDELQQIWDHVKSKKVYAYQQDQLIQVTEENIDAVFGVAGNYHFSLFPVHLIQDPAHALLISKSIGVSPNLKDLEHSAFASDLVAFLANGNANKVRLYNIGHELSPYLKTLKELRVFTYEQGTIERLLELLRQNQFVSYAESDSVLLINQAQLMIHKHKGADIGNAPDHLQRLFSYNDIMRKAGSRYFAKDYINDDLINEAEKSYVVSPVSSLIVLETREDYERFGIENSRNSLKNASMKSSGAVPEPHEWMLLILAAGSILYLVYRSKFQAKTVKQ